MHESVKFMLEKYQCHSSQDYINALKEILQEIALLGLWRARFFEKAAFYGGSALRILYGLDRFSEDLDFSLLKKDKNFKLTPYNQAIAKELEAFGFHAEVQTKTKKIESNIESAFIKAETKKQFIAIAAPNTLINSTHRMHILKIKMEIDTNPPGLFNTETKFLLQPIPFSVKSYTQPDLFAGKIHAILCRPWLARVKGRDYYDLVWYLSHQIPVNLIHLKERLIQSKFISRKTVLNKEMLIDLLTTKFKQTDFNKAKKNIAPFINNANSIALWSEDFFIKIINKIKTDSIEELHKK